MLLVLLVVLVLLVLLVLLDDVLPVSWARARAATCAAAGWVELVLLLLVLLDVELLDVEVVVLGALELVVLEVLEVVVEPPAVVEVEGAVVLPGPNHWSPAPPLPRVQSVILMLEKLLPVATLRSKY